ncbi:hypothetical protein FHX06_000902 [Rhizobium sp. BK512]|uniref:hypothetical protein n=1 Tax=Rhizobium sp. BK512 TaxID=2587010 RepID=UPI00161621B1|nr:hypothetical protein [Rhizobium sp. BK512]MBB3559605.1 hypothetical protein [Rhizobium sp. BK512]
MVCSFSTNPEEVIQFLVVGAVFLQQMIILAAYLVREIYRTVKKRREANRVARAFE